MTNWLSGMQQIFLANQVILVLGLLLIQIAALVLLSFVILNMNKLRKRYNSLTQGVDNSNLDTVLLQIGDRLQAVENGCNQLNTGLDEHRQTSEFHIQRWSLLRYKAFSNTGGDQSFSMAMLDGKGNGVVISSIYGRDESRIYAKSVQNGKSTYALSSEEEEAIKQALVKEWNT